MLSNDNLFFTVNNYNIIPANAASTSIEAAMEFQRFLRPNALFRFAFFD